VVPEAHRLDAVGYDAMQELAEHGAKVLHAQAVEWARRADIVVHAVATSAPPVAAGGSGTRITPSSPDGARGAVAIAGSRRLVRVRLAGADSQRGAGPATSSDDGEALLALLEAEGVALRRFTLHPAPEALFSPDDVPDLGRVRLALGARFPAVQIDERGEVAAVGPGVGSDPAAIRRALAAVHAVATGRPSCEATPMRLSFYLDGADVDAVTRALHAALIPSASAFGGARPVS
jgi:aspartate kinase